MKYNIENLQSIKEANSEIINLGSSLNKLLNRAVNIRQDLEEAERILLTPEREVTDILRHADLIKEFGEVFGAQLETVKNMNGLINKIYDCLQKDYDATVKTIKA